MRSSRTFFVIASLFGLSAVSLGAFGAHALKSMISPEFLSVFETGVRYQMYHTFAIFVVAWYLQSKPVRKLELGGWFFVAGVVLFSGSLYLLAMTGVRSLALVTPVGGLLLFAGWAMLTLGFLERKKG